MKEINEKEFDMLISESFARENTLQDIETSVMKSIKVDARKVRWTQVLRLATFCICFAIAIILPVAATYYILEASNDLYLNSSVAFGMFITFVVIVKGGNKQMKKFSLDFL